MNGWHDSANIAARARIEQYRSEAANARISRLAREGRPARGGFAFARSKAASALHRLADALAPQSGLNGSEPMRRAGGRPLL
ncbi:MAG: hypothetical protein P8Y02_08625 [Deinococcales bacterium]|jgi:hypothetical protein